MRTGRADAKAPRLIARKSRRIDIAMALIAVAFIALTK